MSDQWVFIEPQDVWMFRDNKPFAAGANFVARSIFPPYPQTIYGVLRTYYLNQIGVNWRAYMAGEIKDAIVGTPTELGSLPLLKLYVAQCTDTGLVEPLFPTPLDLLHNSELDNYRILHPSQNSIITEVPLSNWQPLEGGGTHYKETSGWLAKDGFEHYLNADENAITRELQPQPQDIFLDEGRIGLALDYGKRAHRESFFYRAEFLRLHKDKGLLLHLNEAIFQTPSGMIEIGGESRAGRFKVVNPPSLPANATGDHIKLILLTPAYFEEGWQPKDGDWSQWVTGNLVSAAIGKPVNISGWDVATNTAKPLRRYVPAGSVYYFKGSLVSQDPLTDDADKAKMGFGQFIVGTWHE